MKNTEKICLNWDDFQENLKSSFRELRNEEDFADVTLACEDGTQIQTHRVVLAASSPFFMEILKRSKHPHQVIYMRRLKGEDLIAMVDFLYYGEANVDRESLDSFLGLAQELRLKGVTDSAELHDWEFRRKEETKIEERKLHNQTTPNILRPLNVYNSLETSECLPATLITTEAHQLEEQVKSMMRVTENNITSGKRTVKAYACNVCGKEGHQGNILTHIEANHIASDISHACDICGKTSRSRHGLRQHKVREH